MAFSKTIQMYIFDGNPNGRIMCELSNWNGRVYKISRNELGAFAERPDAENTGIYFLLSKDENNDDALYVGESEHILTRLKQHLNDTPHLKETPYWNDCIVVVSKDNLLNKAHVKFLENKFYGLAKIAGRCKVANRSVPTCSSISEYDEAMLSEFISNTKLLVNTLGYKFFDTIEDSSIKHSSIEQKDNQIFFYIKAARGADAKGVIVADGFAVLKDSTIATSTAPSMSENLIHLRNKLITEGIINSKFHFLKDHIFTSPSLAAAVVMGRNANGRTEWKTSENKTIKDIEEENLT